jgi:hypothetical protein
VPNVLNWHHSVIIIPSSAPDLNSTLIYLDGQLLNGVCSFINYGAPAPNISNLNPIRIGRGWQRDGYYSGTIDDIGIWNRALTQQEITDLYNGNSGITGFNSVTHNNIIKIFPNPANDHLTIDYGNFATMNGYQLKIENSLGQKLFQTNISQQIDYISLNNWGGNGLYFVHVIDAQGNTIDIRKIVLQ